MTCLLIDEEGETEWTNRVGENCCLRPEEKFSEKYVQSTLT